MTRLFFINKRVGGKTRKQAQNGTKVKVECVLSDEGYNTNKSNANERF